MLDWVVIDSGFVVFFRKSSRMMKMCFFFWLVFCVVLVVVILVCCVVFVLVDMLLFGIYFDKMFMVDEVSGMIKDCI